MGTSPNSFQVAPSALGLQEPPPGPVRLKVMAFRGGWVVYLHAPDSDLGEAMAWLERAYGGGRPTLDGTVGYLLLERLPKPLERWIGDGYVAALIERGKDATLLGDPKDEAAVRMLTAKQDHVLSRAAELGYYDVPRGTNLEHLAKDLGMSLGALSETLRRAEGRLVQSYLRRSQP